MYSRFYLGLFVILLISSSLQAEGKVLTLSTAIQEVLDNNADIQAAHYKVDSAQARIRQAKSLEDPMIGVMFWNVPRDTANIRQGEEIDYRIDQKFPFPGKRYLKGKMARYDADMTKHLARSRIEDVLFDLKETYYMAFKLEEQKRINTDIQHLVQILVNTTQAWYAANQTTTETALKAQLELAQLKNENLMLDQEQITHLSHLRALMNRKQHDKIAFPTDITFPQLNEMEKENLLIESLKNRPDIQAMESAEKREKTNLDLAKTNFIPDFSLGFQYNQTRDMKDTWTGSASMNFPLLFIGKRKAEIQEAKAQLKATQAEKDSMLQHQHHEMDQAFSTIVAAKKILDQFEKEIIPQSRLTFESARNAYMFKKIDFMTLIDSVRSYRESQMNEAEQKAFLGISIAKLERLLGASLKGTHEKNF